MRLRSGICALLSAVALGTAFLPTADAAKVSGHSTAGSTASVVQQAGEPQTFYNSHTTYCLVDRGKKSPDNNYVPTMASSGGDRLCDSADASQAWYVSSFGDGWVRIVNVATSRCLDDSPNGLTVGTKCWANGDAKVNYQKWKSSSFGDGKGIRLQNRWSHACLDDSAEHGIRTNVQCASYLSPPLSQSYQSWH